ncbi:MAG TPA: GTPase domain-containing protein [Gemmataceae bacterium]|jgi:GTP-binding protein EngB required for normal cell division|nr:GTPase domain-containing protein [Gemmataceae bacterium]
MQPTDTRAVCIQLGDDLTWLEEHTRQQPELAPQAAQLRLASALVRNTIGPYLERQPPTPLHIVVVGGAGSGKSTVVNFLVGANVAEANPQAGFTRHPVAYADANRNESWPASVGFLGRLQRLAQPTPSNLDEDVYQLRRVSPPPGFSLLQNFVIWDCPDMTTWAATGYIPRLIEVCGLADVIVYAASDERYNDAVPTQFMHLLLEASKPVVVVLTKMKAENAQALLEHFQKEVLGKLPGRMAALLAIPSLSSEELADPVGKAGRHRIPLLNQVSVLGDPPSAARQRTVRTAMHYLAHGAEGFLSVARSDLAALEVWRTMVRNGQTNFDSRYYKEFLLGEQFHRFDEAMVRLIDLLELPGVGKFISDTLYVIRTPFRWIGNFLRKHLSRPEAPQMPERPVMETALNGWLDQLRAEALRRSGQHPLWEHLAKGFESGLPDGARKRFEELFRELQLQQANEVDQIARSIYADLEKKPGLLYSLRTGKLALDIGAIAASIVALGLPHIWWSLVVVPLAVSMTQALVEFFGKQYVDGQREQARRRQQILAQKFVSGPLAEWLLQWPVSGGSSFERLQQVLQRIPASIQQLQQVIQKDNLTP